MTLMVGHYQSGCLVKRFYSSVKVKVTTKVKNLIECLQVLGFFYSTDCFATKIGVLVC